MKVFGINSFKSARVGDFRSSKKTNHPNFGAVIVSKASLEMQLSGYKKLLGSLSTEQLFHRLADIKLNIQKLESWKTEQLELIKNQGWWVLKPKQPQINALMKDYFAKYRALVELQTVILDAFGNRHEKALEIKADAINTMDSYKGFGNLGLKSLKADAEARMGYTKYRGFESIAGYEREKAILDDNIISAIRQERTGEKAIIPGSILFFGPQGNGKSCFAEAFAYEADARVRFLENRGRRGIDAKTKEENFLKRLYEEAQKSEENFQKEGITKNQRTILILDEIDEIAGQKSTIVPQLEDFMKTCSEKYHCTIFATTNYPEKLKLSLGDENIFPIKVSLDPSSLLDKAKILEFYMKDHVTKNVNYQEMAKFIEERENSLQAVFCNAYLKEFALASSTEEELIKCVESTTPNISKNLLQEYSRILDELSRDKVFL